VRQCIRRGFSGKGRPRGALDHLRNLRLYVSTLPMMKTAFVVHDSNGQAGLFLFRRGAHRRAVNKRLTKDEARRMARELCKAAGTEAASARFDMMHALKRQLCQLQALAVEIGYWLGESNCSGRSLPDRGGM
jgi:hypothetical protein